MQSCAFEGALLHLGLRSHGAEMELILANLVDELDADNDAPRVVERFESEHRLYA